VNWFDPAHLHGFRGHNAPPTKIVVSFHVNSAQFNDNRRCGVAIVTDRIQCGVRTWMAGNCMKKLTMRRVYDGDYLYHILCEKSSRIQCELAMQ
jgi:hypothetical protein